MSHQEFNFTIYNTNFFGQYWEAHNTKAVIVLAHGMGEHSSRFQHVAEKLLENNFSVVAFDHFGHGKTAGKRGHNPSFDAVLESIQKTIEKAEILFPEKPIFLYGHSMGGNSVINFALRKSHNLKGVIATSPFLKLAFQPPIIKLALGKLLQKIAPSITLGNELNPNHLSRDEKEVEKYKNDALVHNKISPNFSITFIESGKWAIENGNRLTVPMLILHGTDDKIIDYRGSEEFAKNAVNATLKLYKGGYHELQNDLCKDEMLQDVVDWLDSQL
ncbi:MAG: alpha/beta hydrolase [Flavobacteriia bacterium]|nr:alpha/beta hydrolase [Flavobacteriia bacterium]OIP47349.1 MAG: alpha/beta hydrolase [Flavobacteriaceae bacterium CG2_30_31_66]PIV95599.1 MAG: alpha/beta hydrolase [Flavobacteriaceae bacterium CG17_big_fil_post_rev_8_21_14_2_50_31_13]PIY15978.1 MAG: alpha/beta hydrolase [Flavobacteriaceae bacterium CG_4_10_14_3_um_filter_31_253]PIZ11543.1 MAG: alpha/beta hydrolase [Flavobacteriaceae bacterium CG_4_10_14_0_8_um_filter_31_99]PJC09705.1 MAG: alpha/beta hydrolase [Flavobacteriaceae bacterium CG_